MGLPSTNEKLTAPSKKSIFERQKEEAEAKKARDRAETEAVYEDFVKSFEQDDKYVTPTDRGRSNTGGFASGPGIGKRHFTSSGLKSGPGSLGPALVNPKSGPGSLGPVFGRKRNFEDEQYHRERERPDYHMSDARRESRDDVEEKTARPTLRLSSLPPGTSSSVIKALFSQSPLTIEDVRILSGSSSERKAVSAIVTLAAETAATDIDAMVSSLQNKYLGYGFNLSISRHLSSAALGGGSGLGAVGSGGISLPFGARPIQQQTSLSRAPPPGQGRGFAPPASYTSSTPYQRREQSQVLVHPPNDLKQLRLIHKTIETLLSHGPEFEALLMSRPEVQRDLQWAWLWDPKSPGGVYYRWRLWKILTGSQRESARLYATKTEGEFLFDGHSIWLPSSDQPKFEYTTTVSEIVSDDDYDSSDEEADFEEGNLSKRHNDHNVSALTADNPDADGHGYLNPLAKTKLIHLLTRLPDANAKLRRGDVMRITAFAIEHAGSGAAEVASIITRNVVQPLNIYRTEQDKEDKSKDPASTINPDDASPDKRDTSPSSLVSLLVISDILSASASSGVRHAWRYRQLFEQALIQQKTFQKIGRLDRDLNWGKMKAEKWKRSVQNLLSLWEGWCVFPQSGWEDMSNGFLEPPLSKAEQRRADEEEEERRAQEDVEKRKKENNWRSIGDAVTEKDVRGVGEMDVDGREMSDDEGDEPEDAMEIDEATLVDETVDGTAMADSSDEEMAEDIPPPPPPSEPAPEPTPPRADYQSSPQKETNKTPISKGRQRPRATDMFADDDSDG